MARNYAHRTRENHLRAQITLNELNLEKRKEVHRKQLEKHLEKLEQAKQDYQKFLNEQSETETK